MHSKTYRNWNYIYYNVWNLFKVLMEGASITDRTQFNSNSYNYHLAFNNLSFIRHVCHFSIKITLDQIITSIENFIIPQVGKHIKFLKNGNSVKYLVYSCFSSLIFQGKLLPFNKSICINQLVPRKFYFFKCLMGLIKFHIFKNLMGLRKVYLFKRLKFTGPCVQWIYNSGIFLLSSNTIYNRILLILQSLEKFMLELVLKFLDILVPTHICS